MALDNEVDDYTFAEVDPPYEDEDGIIHWPDCEDYDLDMDDLDDDFYDDDGCDEDWYEGDFLDD